jgi:hypothetical protein
LILVRTTRTKIKESEEDIMNPKKPKNSETYQAGQFNPYNEPRTIPSGWNVAAFYAPEQSNPSPVGMYTMSSDLSEPTETDNDETTNLVS